MSKYKEKTFHDTAQSDSAANNGQYQRRFLMNDGKREFPKIQQRGGVSCYTVVILINGGFLMAQIFGYARVSTREQNEARQLLALREFGVEDERIFTDRQSGKDFDRPAYRRLVRRQCPRPAVGGLRHAPFLPHS